MITEAEGSSETSVHYIAKSSNIQSQQCENLKNSGLNYCIFARMFQNRKVNKSDNFERNKIEIKIIIITYVTADTW